MWEVRLRGCETCEPGAAELREFERWRLSSEDNELAWDALQERLARMGGAGTGANVGQGARARGNAAMARALRAPSEERRRALRAGFGMLVLGLGAWGASEGIHGLGLDADWRSAVGQQGEGVLADGTPVAYDADSRIYLAGGSVAPVLTLRQGQLLLRPSAHAGGAVSVTTTHGTVTGEGAVFTIGRLRDRSVVSLSAEVAGGAVDAVLRQSGRAALVLQPGQTVYFDRHGAQPSDLSFGAVSAWRRGVYVADRVRLDELLEVFGRHRGGLLRASGGAAGRQVSGVFRLDDIERALLQVADALPLKLTRYGRYLSVFS